MPSCEQRGQLIEEQSFRLKMNDFFPWLLLFALLSSVLARQECIHRDYENGATVCVCNSTTCDDLTPISKTATGIVTSYSTSKSGDRFSERRLHFTNKIISYVKPTISVTINYKKTYQKIIGFGGAFTDAAGINIAKLSSNLQIRLVKDYFASDGIEYTLGRIPIGGSDFSTRPYSYDDHANDESLSKFALEPEDFKYKIPYLLLAQKVSSHVVKYFGSPWSSPAWMKDNGEINHGGFLKGHPGGKYYQLFGRYIARFLDEYHHCNVSIWGITIENEPGAGFDKKYKWNSLGFNGTLERDFIKLDLGPELHRHGYNKDKLKIMVHDDQLTNIKNFSVAILSDPSAAKFVSGIAFHWYHNAEGNRDDLDWLHDHFQNQYFILPTEACEEWAGHSEHVSLGNWATFNRYTDDIINDLNHFATGWTDWNLALDLQGGPNWVGNFVDAPIIVNATSQEYYKQPFFYALGHFSKFLVPGSVRVHHDSNTTDRNILVTVFQRPDSGNVLTLLNKNVYPIVLHLYDPLNGHLNVHVKAEAIESFIWY